MNKKDIEKADKSIVKTFKELIRLVLTFLSGLLLIIMPLVFVPFAIVCFLSRDWLEGLGYLALVILSIYTARALMKIIRKD